MPSILLIIAFGFLFVTVSSRLTGERLIVESHFRHDRRHVLEPAINQKLLFAPLAALN